MSVAELSIKRPVTTVMLFISLFVVGLIASLRLPLEVERVVEHRLVGIHGDRPRAARVRRMADTAWLALPPVEVRMPFARCMPATSSGLVSLRTSMIGSSGFVSAYSTARSAVRMMRPDAAPGEAAMPWATGLFLLLGSSCGMRR